MRRTLRVVAAGATVLGLGGVGAIVQAGSASAAGTFVNPSAAFTIAADTATGNFGNPIRPTITVSNFAANTNVNLIICDGVPPTTQGYLTNQHCDNTTAPSPILSTGPTAQETFAPSSDPASAVIPFRGQGGSDLFNCLAPEDIKTGATPNPRLGGNVVPKADTTANGNPIDTAVPSWNDCQLRAAGNNANNTADQAYLTFSLSNSPAQVLPTPSVAAVTGMPTSSTYQQSVTLTTTVASTNGGATPTGTVNFENNGTTITGCGAEMVTSSGSATCPTSALPTGTGNSLTAVYSGSSAYNGTSSTPATYTVAKATPTAALNSVPTTKAGTNSSVTFTDTLTGVTNGTTPSGTVAFSVGGTAITGCSNQTVSSTGTATCTTSFPSASTPTITATYSGDTNYSAGTAATENFTVVVLPIPTVTLSVAPPSGAIYGSSETLTATVTSTSGTAPTGSVTFQDGGTAISTACTSVAVNSGSANCGPIVLPVGTDSLSAVYSGDTNYGGTTKTVSYPVSQATPTVSLSALPATTQYQGGSVTLTAAVASSAGTPSGSVAFDVGGTALTACAAQTITAGQATCTTTALPVGTDSLTAVYSGDTNFTSVTSTPAVSYTVTPRTATSLSVMASPASPQVAGTTVTITASVAPATTGGVTPTGTISFTTGGAAINGCTNVTVDATGSASCATSNLPVGTDTVTATYSGDSSYIGSSGPVTYTITSPPVTTEQLPAGYHLVAKDGGVFAFGGAGFYGSEGGQHINAPIVGLAESVDQQGYWLVGSDGGVYAFGDAPFLGSLGNIHLKAPIVGITPTSDGGGYWLVASDGGVFAFGDAGYFGSLGGVNLAKPVVGIASTPDDGGYWLVASDGGVFAFGDAPFLGSAGGTPLAKPVVGIAPTFDGGGYWLAASDGGVFAYGDAPFAGSAGGTALAKPVVGIAEAPEGGYRLVASDGGVFNYGGAQFFGSTGGLALQAPIAGVASTGGTLIIVNEADEAAAVHHPSGLKERFTPKG